jgi:outer membrane protein insertion porin family
MKGLMQLGVCLLSGVLVCSAPAQQKKRAASAPPPPEKEQVFPLETLKVKGNLRVTSEKIVTVSGLKVGSPVVKPDFDTARNRLLATGAFESVGYEFKPSADNQGYDGTLEVDQIYSYRFEELPLADDVLRAALRKQEPILGDQVPATKEVMDRYVGAIQNLVGQDIKVTGKLYSDIPGQLMIVFRPNTPRLQVAEVRFMGNGVLPSTLLASTFAGVAVGTGYNETTIRMLLDSSIRPLYDSRGRIRVAFPKIAAVQAPLIDGVVVTVTVSEGASYSLGQLTFSGVANADLADLPKTANIQTKDVVNFDEIKAGLERIFERYRGKGYLRVSGHLDRQINDTAHTVDVTETLDLGPQFTMGKLEILGLDITTEPEIRKIWTLKPGTPFQPKYPDAFLKNIRDQDLFDNLGKTRAESNIDDKSHVVNVKLYFTSAEEEQRRKKKSPLLF